MINITSNEFKRLQGRHNDFESPTYDMRKGPPWQHSLPHCLPPVVHRKSSSMDSQVVAAHAHLNHMHRNASVCSTEQLDRNLDGIDSPTRLPPLHKLSVASYPLASSKSSVDLHIALGAETSSVCGDGTRLYRSQSNSSDPEGCDKRSRSPSPEGGDAPSKTAAQEPEEQPNKIRSDLTTPAEVTAFAAAGEDELAHPQGGRRFEKDITPQTGLMC